jgi:glycosyltransferase involved in cell wall biosynthesis
MSKPYLSIILPAYNEAERIPATLLDIDKRMAGKEYTYEVVVVNDGSKDNTAEVVKKLMPAVRNLKLIDNIENKGKGGVVRQGMLAATGDIRLFMDSDNATTIDHFDRMEEWFPPKDGSASGGQHQYFDVVICSRAMKGSELDPPEPWYRQIPGKLGNMFWIQPLLLWGLWDTQCGFKAFTAECAEKVFSHSKLSGWSFDVEVLGLAMAMGYRVKEVPVHWKHDGKSKVKASAYLQVLLDVARLRWWFWMDAYGLRSGK